MIYILISRMLMHVLYVPLCVINAILDRCLAHSYRNAKYNRLQQQSKDYKAVFQFLVTYLWIFYKLDLRTVSQYWRGRNQSDNAPLSLTQPNLIVEYIS